jgi:hypothetical protein
MELAVLLWSQHQIAADLGISQAAVSKLLKRIETRVLRELAETVERQKARQTLRLEHQYAEAMRAWEESKVDTTRKRQRKTHGGSGGTDATVAEVVVENQHGDPRYLEVARKALADVRKVWGLDAPHQLDVRAQNPYDGMTEEALRDELARQSRLLDVPSAEPRTVGPPASDHATAMSPAPTSAPSPKDTDDAEHQ